MSQNTSRGTIRPNMISLRKALTGWGKICQKLQFDPDNSPDVYLLLPPYLLPSPPPETFFVDFRFGYIKSPPPPPNRTFSRTLWLLHMYTGRLPYRFPVVRAKSPPPPPHPPSKKQETEKSVRCIIETQAHKRPFSSIERAYPILRNTLYYGLFVVHGAKLNIPFFAMQCQLNK